MKSLSKLLFSIFLCFSIASQSQNDLSYFTSGKFSTDSTRQKLIQLDSLLAKGKIDYNFGSDLYRFSLYVAFKEQANGKNADQKLADLYSFILNKKLSGSFLSTILMYPLDLAIQEKIASLSDPQVSLTALQNEFTGLVKYAIKANEITLYHALFFRNFENQSKGLKEKEKILKGIELSNIRQDLDHANIQMQFIYEYLYHLRIIEKKSYKDIMEEFKALNSKKRIFQNSANNIEYTVAALYLMLEDKEFLKKDKAGKLKVLKDLETNKYIPYTNALKNTFDLN